MTRSSLTATPDIHEPHLVVAVQRPPQVMCPSWCDVSQEAHLEQLHGMEGFVIHSCGDRLLAAKATGHFSIVSFVDGAPDPHDVPQIFIEVGFQDGTTLENAEAFAHALLALIEEVRA